jgi:hypothetical protein
MSSPIRRKKLVKPALQLKIVLTLLGTAGLCVLIQTIMLSRSLSAVSGLSLAENDELMLQLPGILVRNLVVTLTILIPLILVIGTLVTFRIAGPVYRFEKFFENLAAGKQAEPCRLRERDELHELCALINAATGSLLLQAQGDAQAPATDLEDAPAIRTSSATREEADAVSES